MLGHTICVFLQVVYWRKVQIDKSVKDLQDCSKTSPNQNFTSEMDTLIQADLPKPITRPLAAAAIGAKVFSALEFIEPKSGLIESGKSESMWAGVGGADNASNVKDVWTPAASGITTVTMMLVSSFLAAFHGRLCCSKNISSRRSGAAYSEGG